MVESYKIKSKLITAIGGIATIISVLGVNQLEALFPEFGKFIPAIVAIATWYTSQISENKRVERAEQIVHEQYQESETNAVDSESKDENIVVNLTLDGEDIVSGDGIINDIEDEVVLDDEMIDDIDDVVPDDKDGA